MISLTSPAGTTTCCEMASLYWCILVKACTGRRFQARMIGSSIFSYSLDGNHLYRTSALRAKRGKVRCHDLLYFNAKQWKTAKEPQTCVAIRIVTFFFFFFEKGFVMSMERGRGRLKNGDPGASHDIEAWVRFKEKKKRKLRDDQKRARSSGTLPASITA